MDLKRKGIAFSLEMVFNLIVIGLVFGGGLYLGMQTVENCRRELLIEQAKAIDHALDRFAKAHIGVDGTTVTLNKEKMKLNYDKMRYYPETLQELGVIRDDFGYLSKHLKFKLLDTTVHYDVFQYSVNKEANGKMTYQLEVLLPDGYIYTSPGSNK